MTDQLTDDQKRALAERLNDLARKSNSSISVLIESGRIKFCVIPKMNQQMPREERVD